VLGGLGGLEAAVEEVERIGVDVWDGSLVLEPRVELLNNFL
jgi:hypothetical protein